LDCAAAANPAAPNWALASAIEDLVELLGRTPWRTAAQMAA
jgi:hypothetical protein